VTEYYWVPEDFMFENGEDCLAMCKSRLQLSAVKGPATKVADSVRYVEVKQLLRSSRLYVRDGCGGCDSCSACELFDEINKALGDGT
jgi:hypothetical protein